MEMKDITHHGYNNNCFVYHDSDKRSMLEIRNLEIWEYDGKIYTEIYDGPIDDERDRYWLLSLNLRAQSRNQFDLWWTKKKYLYYKVVKQEEIKKEMQMICDKIINGYKREFQHQLNIPICINNIIVSSLMVDVCVFKEFYVAKDIYHSPSMSKEILNPPPESLNAKNIQWKSKWDGPPTGWEYKGPKELYYYNYYEDYDKNGKPIPDLWSHLWQ